MHLTRAPYVLQPLMFNPNYPPSLERGTYQRWEKWEEKPTKIRDMIRGDKIIPLQEIQERWGKHPRDIWGYNQLYYFISMKRERNWDRPLTQCQEIIETDPDLMKPLSKMILNCVEL
ncbi:hypothetical protein XELAEV_18027000mg [Xenopus laevis]|uniref:Uncharacterized protein n=1 Tax=Xenopus laevis TaxID=8355 RepID=A0A974CX35_XENLA|nr:hypothetical protein XELAEV_18027000mg [Xenopus laevis]